MPEPLPRLLQTLENAARLAGRPSPRLLAVSKFQDATAVAELAAAWRRERPGEVPAFGENYVQEAQAKQAELADPGLEWHLPGTLPAPGAGQFRDRRRTLELAHRQQSRGWPSSQPGRVF